MTKRQRLVLGLVDHGTRACISLTELADKRSLTILREIVAAIRQFGFPTKIRVDNEASLKSRLMRAALRVLGIELQIVAMRVPDDGKIERFFGSFKAAISRIVIEGADPRRLIELRAFYNHVRMHQHIDGRTPPRPEPALRSSTARTASSSRSGTANSAAGTSRCASNTPSQAKVPNNAAARTSRSKPARLERSFPARRSAKKPALRTGFDVQMLAGDRTSLHRSVVRSEKMLVGETGWLGRAWHRADACKYTAPHHDVRRQARLCPATLAASRRSPPDAADRTRARSAADRAPERSNA
ncbi:MAG: hypothetical protein IPH76_05500 [Xanthomonadales bacterium]|nr:hypothetical protein [Xanthomonadales bacterium]